MSAIAARLRTASLVVVPATPAHLEAELAGREELARLFDADVPESWPPGEYDRAAQEFFLDSLERAGPDGVGWYAWYALRPADAIARSTVVGAAGYFGRPGGDGVVEIGYSICPEWRRRGYATEVAGALARHAAAQPGVAGVIAHTSATNAASLAVLARSGFVPAGTGGEPGSLRFAWAAARGIAPVAPGATP